MKHITWVLLVVLLCPVAAAAALFGLVSLEDGIYHLLFGSDPDFEDDDN